jgi:iron complex transport system substrate-binding protein
MLLVATTVLMVACGGGSGSDEEAPTGPLVLTDAVGREVTLPEKVERVVTLAPSVTESLYAIGAGEQVVGRTEFDNYPPEVEALPVVGGFSADQVNVETVVSLGSDVVLGGSDLQQPLAEAFEAAGVTFFVFNPETIDEIYQMLDLLGQITGHEDGAQAVIDDMQTRIAAVEEAIADVSEEERPTVFYEVWDEPLLTAGPTTYIGEMLVLAGGVDIFADLEKPYSQVSAETVIERQPEFILGPDTHGDALTPESLAARPGWETIPAVQNNAVVLMDGDIMSRSGPRVVEAIELMAAALYPDRFGG